MNVIVNAHYHVAPDCVQMDAAFTSDQLIILMHLREKFKSNAAYGVLLKQEFGINV